MTMQRLIMMLSLAFFSVPPSHSAQRADSLTLERAVFFALKNNPAVSVASFEAKAARERYLTAKAAFYPQVNGNGSYARIGPVSTIVIPPIGALSLFPADNYNVSIDLSMVIYDFGARGALASSVKSEQEAAESRLAVAQSEIALIAVTVFSTAVFLRGEIEVLGNQIAELGLHLNNAKKRTATGSGVAFDTLSASVRIAEVAGQKIAVMKDYKKQIALLSEITGLPRSDTGIVTFAFLSDYAPPDEDSLIILVKRRLPGIASLRNERDAAVLAFRRSKSLRFPALTVMASGGIKNGFVPDINKAMADWSAGAQLSVPLFDGFRKSHAINENAARLAAAEERVRDAEHKAETAVLQTLDDLNADREQIKVAERREEQARQALVIARDRYAAGTITELEALDASTALALAELAVKRSRYELTVHYFNLKTATGDRWWEAMRKICFQK